MVTAMIECKQCGVTKPKVEYYVSNQSKCKDCVKTGVQSNRTKNLEYYREYDRQRANNPERVSAREAYQETEHGKEAILRGKRAYINRNRRKREAHVTLGNAIRSRRVIPLPCEVCGEEKTEAHHTDYSKPLMVNWLCGKHHRLLHKQFRQTLREQGVK